MAYIINNNHFSVDSYSLRGSRFDNLSSNISKYAVELSLEAAMLDWAVNASDIWDDFLQTHVRDLGKRDKAYQTSQEADDALYDKYTDLKALLVSRYSEEPDQLRIFGVEGNMPYKRDQKVSKAFDLIRGNEMRAAEGDPRVLPANLIDALQTLADEAVNMYYLARKKLDASMDMTKEFRELFVQDSYRLNSLFNWAVAFWGSRDPKLDEIGFVKKKPRGGKKIKPPGNLSFDPENNLFTWDALEDATSYQLGYAQHGKKNYSEAYQGDDTKAVFAPGHGDWDFVVRARNMHGFGKWGDVLEVAAEPVI